MGLKSSPFKVEYLCFLDTGEFKSYQLVSTTTQMLFLAKVMVCQRLAHWDIIFSMCMANHLVLT